MLYIINNILDFEDGEVKLNGLLNNEDTGLVANSVVVNRC